MRREELEELVNRYFDGGLDAPGLALLERELKASVESRQVYWEVAEIHGILGEVCDETLGARTGTILTGPPEPGGAWSRMRWAGVAAAVAAAIFMGFLWKGNFAREIEAAVVATMEDRQGRVEFLEVGKFHVEAARSVELVFRGGARVAIEGLAEMVLLSPDRMRLVRGRIGVEVPEGAEGFTVETPDGQVVDFGTRFGLEVGKRGVVKAEVFEGRIDVMLGREVHRMEGRASLWLDDQGAGTVVAGADERAFPMPRSELSWSVGGSFDSREDFPGGKPSKINQWSGDYCEVRRESPGVTPKVGAGMLQFLATHSKGDQTASNVAGELWRVVDLDQVTHKMGRRPERVTLSGWFNRVSGGSGTDSRFIMGMWEGRRGAERFEWDRAGDSGTEVLTDGDVDSWERADLEMVIDSEIRFLVLMVGAFENVRNEEEVGERELDGHFVDDVKLRFSSELRASSKTRFWRGGEGDWDFPGKWSENVLPTGRESAVIQGGSATISGEVLLTDSDVMVALDAKSKGELLIERSGRLELGRRELILGYNPGGQARMTLEGSFSSGGFVFIGRNNDSSKLVIDGGSLVTSERVQLAQYDSAQDTQSEVIIRNGGRLKAGSLRLIHDDARLLLEDGIVEVDLLELGSGESGSEVEIVQTGGVVRAERVRVDGGKYDLRGGSLILKGEWDAGRWQEEFQAGTDGLRFQNLEPGWTNISR
ncbi:FecR domain-containing protein [Verrucomicrobiaceae bacterium 227]